MIGLLALIGVACGGSGAVSTPTMQNPAASKNTISSTANVAAIGGDTTITLSWAPVAGASAYNLYWTTGTVVSTQSGTQIALVTSPYAHTALTNGTVHSYAVTAILPAGESVLSCQVDMQAIINGGFTSCGTPGGTQADPVYDLTLNPTLPQPISHDYIRLADIQQISYFRSAAGHENVDGFEPRFSNRAKFPMEAIRELH